jgi:hypothetical protein
VIFNHLLTLLVGLEVLDETFGIAAQLRLWRRLFGDSTDDDPGFYGTLDEDDRLAAWEVFCRRHGEAITVIGMCQAARTTRQDGWDEARIDLRNLWRGLLGGEQSMLAITDDLVAAATAHTPVPSGSAGDAAAELEALARHHTPAELASAVAAAVDARSNSVRMGRGQVRRGSRGESVEEQLIIDDPEARLTWSTAEAAIAAWMALEPDRDYYRLEHRTGKTVAVYDTAHSDRWWVDRITGTVTDLPHIQPTDETWSRSLASLTNKAATLRRTAA